MPARDTSATITTATAARTVAAPVSSRSRSPEGFAGGDRFAADDNPGQKGRTIGDPRNDVTPTAAQFHCGTGRSQTAGDTDSQTVAAGGQSGDLTSRINTAHLHRQSRCAGEAEHRDADQTRDGQRSLHRAEPGITCQTLVVSARLMMLVNAPTMESPVTTL